MIAPNIVDWPNATDMNAEMAAFEDLADLMPEIRGSVMRVEERVESYAYFDHEQHTYTWHAFPKDFALYWYLRGIVFGSGLITTHAPKRDFARIARSNG